MRADMGQSSISERKAGKTKALLSSRAVLVRNHIGRILNQKMDVAKIRIAHYSGGR